MPKIYLPFLWILFHSALPLFGQLSFFDASNRLSNQTIRSGAAMGIADMNNDGLDDIIRLDQGQNLYIAYQASNGTFSSYNVGPVQGTQWSLCVADVDRNNYNDIFTGGAYNTLKLVRANNAGSAYIISTIAAQSIFLQGSNFADINRDGLADIFACHDEGLSLPLRNTGNGVFVTDFNLINPISTVPSDNSGNYGSVWIDYNNDGKLDLYISKCRAGVNNPLDGRRLNLLFRNNGDGTFTEVAESAGLRPLAQSWAADFADIDNDGDLDCFLITHDSPSRLYVNNGFGQFTEITAQSGMLPAINSAGPGLQVKFEDFDNDGFVDLLYTSLGSNHLLFHNDGNGTFSNVPGAFPTGGNRIHSATTGDLDNNGYMDVYASFGSGYNTPGTLPDKLFLNQYSGNNYFKVLVRGIASNINGIGARIEIYGAWGKQIREVRSGESYGIMSSFTRHFGLGAANKIDSLLVRWPSGVVDRILNPAINQTLQVLEASNCVLSINFAQQVDVTTVSFTDRSTLGAVQWLWNFGDGSTSTLQNPTHTYAAPGVYQVCLSVSGVCGNGFFCTSVNVGCLPPVPGFSAQNPNGLSVQFTDQTINNPNLWLWNFGDGTTSNAQNPQHTYPVAGTYLVCLSVLNDCGFGQFCKLVQVGCTPGQVGYQATITDLSAAFNGFASLPALQWRWTFGDGQTSMMQNPSHTYAQPGVYQVCLEVTNFCGTISVCDSITVNCSAPPAGFSYLVNNLSVILEDISPGDPTAWLWTFGDGTSSTMPSPAHTYALPGTYQICLQVSNVCGSSQVCQTLTVNCPAPVSAFSIQLAGFNASLTDLSFNNPAQWNWTLNGVQVSTQQNPQLTLPGPGVFEICLQTSSICGPGAAVCQTVTVGCPLPVTAWSFQANELTVNFSDQTTGNPNTWNWNFGNGITSTQQNPQISYAAPGIYQVCLQTANLCGPGLQVCQSVTLSCPAPVAAFSAQANGLTVTLNNQSTGGATSWNWALGNGTTSTQQNPQVTYAAPGTYQICLQASSICGTSTQVCQSVTLSCAPPVAAFSAQANGLTVTLNNQSTGGATSWNWTFGNGTTSTQQNPQVIYAAPGTYQICLQASSICGTGTQVCQSVTLSCAPPVAAFSAQANGLTVILNNQSTGGATSWNWALGNGTTSTQQNPQVTYTAPGTYQICLQASSICGTSTQVCQSVTLSCAPPVAAFSAQANGLTVTLSDQSTGGPTQWDWTFGNGAGSMQQNPQVTYPVPGTYTICLQSGSICGVGMQVCQSVTVSCPAPVAVFSAQANGLTVTLNNQSTGGATSWNWTFGNGTTSTQQNPQVTYALPGTYQICLQASSVCGTGAQVCQSVTVSCPAPVAIFSAQANGLTVTLNNQSTGGATSWNWTFGNGTTSTQQNPQVTYAAPGTYQICLQASSICGTGAQLCQTVAVSCPAPQAAFTAVLNGLQATFTDNSGGTPTQWVWSFGDGSTSTQQNPAHTYAAPGSYMVCLQAASLCGTNLRCETVVITCAPPVASFSISFVGQLLLFSDASQNNPTQWLWNFGDGTISTEQNSLHLYPQNGSYLVCLIASNNCGADTICQNVIVGPVSTNEPGSNLRFSAAPNPVSETLTVSVAGAPSGDAMLWMADALGRRAGRWTWRLDGSAQQQLSLPVQDLPPGVYWLILQTGDKVVSLKVVKH